VQGRIYCCSRLKSGLKSDLTGGLKTDLEIALKTDVKTDVNRRPIGK
jgi:hypothetical protein